MTAASKIKRKTLFYIIVIMGQIAKGWFSYLSLVLFALFGLWELIIKGIFT